MKNILAIFSLFILVSCQNYVQAQENTTFKTIVLRVEGEVETLPDIATFHINLSCLEKSIIASKDCLVKKSNELNKQLLAFGIKSDDILTTTINLNKSYTWEKNTKIFEGYKSATSIHVTVKNITNLDEIYTSLLENENLDLGGLHFSHSQLSNLKNDAYVDALKKANILADKLLKELPESKKEVLKIGNVQITASSPKPEMMRTAEYDMDAASSKSSTVNISKGTLKVNAILFVEYQIK